MNSGCEFWLGILAGPQRRPPAKHPCHRGKKRIPRGDCFATRLSYPLQRLFLSQRLSLSQAAAVQGRGTASGAQRPR
ncbi:MAG: hypothetical protein ACK57U_02715, partial [Planctomycetota bacterium]